MPRPLPPRSARRRRPLARCTGRTRTGGGVTMTERPTPSRTTDTPTAAAALYFGKVMHARLKPMGHRFTYRVMSLLIDLDRLDEADRLSPLFGVNRAALYSFREADHGERDGSSLRAYAQARAREHG